MTTTARRSRRLIRLLVALAGLVVLWTFGSAGPASAHAGLVDTRPESGAVMDTAPRDLQLNFNEPVAPVDTAFTLYDSAGRYTANDGAEGKVAVTSLDTTVTAQLPPSLPDGSYLLSWRVVSADSHPISGVLAFAVGEASATAPSAPVADPESLGNPVNTVYLALQVLGYLGLLGAVGMTVFDQVVVPPPGRPRARSRLLVLGVGLAVSAYALLTALTVLRERGDPLSQLGTLAPWRDGWSTSAAATFVLAAAGGLLLLVAARLDRPVSQVVGLVGSLTAIASVLPTGHTRTYGPSWLVVGLDVVHAGTAAVWFGGLIGLGLHLVRARRAQSDAVEAATVVARFSAMAGVLVGLLGLSGLGMAIIILGSFRATFGTDYGQSLLVKLALVAVIGLLAVWNRAYLVKAVRRRAAPESQWRRLRGAVLDEAVLLVVALAVTGLLTMKSPTDDPGAGDPAAAASSAATNLQRVPFGTGSLQGRLLPARVGPNTFEFTLRDSDGAPLTTKTEPEVSASLPSGGLGPLPATLEKLEGTSQYRAQLQLPVEGTWQLVVTIPTKTFEPPTSTLDVQVTG